MKKRIKRIISLITCLILSAVSVDNAYAYIKPGPHEWDMDFAYISDIHGAKLDDAVIKAKDGGYVVFDYYIEMEAEKFEIHYTDAKGASITVESENYPAEKLKLTGSSGKIRYTFPSVQRSGDRKLTLRFSGDVTVSKVHFFAKRQSKWTPKAYRRMGVSQEEFDISTAVILNPESSMLLVNGGRRYVDEQNTSLKPLLADGKIYLPIKTLARALGYYHEEMTDKDYCMLRLEQKSYIYKNGSMVYRNGHDEAKSIDVVPKLIEGKYWLPVRYFAEEIGETVLWKQGYAVIDGHTHANKIVNDKKLFAFVTNKFARFIGSGAVGNTYYVAQTFNASDDNSGTIDAPFKTLAKAGKVAKAGDTVIIREGVYREILKPQNDGTELSPIVFRAAEGENVTIAATRKINNFVDIGDGLAAAKLSVDLGEGRNQLFYKNDCLIEARYPNDPTIPMAETREPLSKLFPVRGDFMVTDEDDSVVVSDTLLNQTENDYWKGAIYVSMHGYGWSLASAKVDSSEPGKLHLTDKSKRWWFDPALSSKADWGYLSGHINCMDLPGEWVVKDDTLFIIPPEGESAETLEVEVKERQLAIDLSDRMFIRVEGLNTLGGSALMNGSEMCTLDSLNMSYISHFTWCDDWREAYIEGYSPENEIAGKSQRVNGESGIYISGKDNRIINSRIDHSAGAGIILTGLYGYIENNILSNCGYMGSYTSGISATQDSTKSYNHPAGGFALYNNTVYNCGRSCLNIQSQQDIWKNIGASTALLPYEVAYNDFHDGILFSLDTGITYAYGTTVMTERLDSKMHNNYVYYTLPDTNPYSFGLYHDGNSHGIDTWENIVFTTEPDVAFTSRPVYTNATLSPNIMWNNSGLAGTYVPKGPENLMVEQFPYAQPFYAGSYLDAEPFMRNYNDEADAVKICHAKNANHSPNTAVDKNGSIALNTKEDWIEFKDVDFGEDGKNIVNIYFRGDRFRGAATRIQFGFGESLETADFFVFEMTPGADTLDQLDSVTQSFGKITGKTNVYMRTLNNEPIAIDSLIFSKNDNYKMASYDGRKVDGGAFTRVDRIGGTAPSALVNAEFGNYVKDVWGGTILRYQNVTIPEGCKVFYANSGSQAPYAGQDIVFSYNIIGEPGNTYIAKITTLDNGWYDKTHRQYVVLDEEMPAGMVDIYVEFFGDNKSCNFLEFGFLDEIPQNDQ